MGLKRKQWLGILIFLVGYFLIAFGGISLASYAIDSLPESLKMLTTPIQIFFVCVIAGGILTLTLTVIHTCIEREKPINGNKTAEI